MDIAARASESVERDDAPADRGASREARRGARRGATVAGAAIAGLVLAGAYAWRAAGPGSPRWRFRRAAATPAAPADRVATEADLGGLPAPVARLVRASGAVGRPIPTGLHARFTGRIRSAPDASWMPFTAEQVSTFAPRETRWFHMRATMNGLPVEVLHHLDGRTATMRADALSLIPVVSMRGPEADRAEAVTFLNDLCLLAPGALLAAPVTWRDVDDAQAEAVYDHRGEVVAATVEVDEDGRLVDFVSSDRLADAGTPSARRLDWSTPVDAHEERDGRMLPVHGAARWREDGSWWTYIETRIDEVTLR